MRRAVLFVIACLVVSGGPAQAEWSIWKTEKTITPLVDRRPIVTRAAPNGPSFMSRVGAGTKKVARGTWDVVTLKPIRDRFSEPEPKVNPLPATMGPSYSTGAEPKAGPFSSWFGKPK